ncbi:MMPL family transporter [Teredinibacter turnerae]|uniref:MMPL family transporter n=1 Tax=Teredinibacter turnerae TaxID=2426 RepID=UPI00035C21E2|nr:MMPL family transporter [Teredinibacter turnerae]
MKLSPAYSNHRQYAAGVRVIFALLSLLIGAAVVDNTVHHKWRISADMAHMIDTNTSDSVVTRWNTESARQFENQFVLVINTPLDDAAYNREEAIETAIDTFEATHETLFVAVDHSESLSPLVDKLIQHRFNFADIQAGRSAEDVAASIIARAYGAGFEGVPGLSLLNDPQGILQARLTDFLPHPQADVFANRIAIINDNTSPSILLSYQILGSGLDLATQATLVDAVDQLESALAPLLPEAQLWRLGPVFHAQFAAASMKSDLSVIATGSTLGILILFLAMFGRPQALLVSIGSITFGFATAFTLCNWLFAQLHFIVLVFGASLIGVCVDFSLHVFARYYQTPEDDGKQVFSAIFSPLLLSLASSVLGYLCLSFSGLSSLQQIAVFSCLGLSAAWLFLGTIACSLRRAHKPALLLPSLTRYLSTAIGKGAKKRPLINSALLAGLIAVAAASASLYSTSDNPRLMYHASPKLINDLKHAASVIQEFDPSRAILVSGHSEDAVMKKLAALQTPLEQWRADGLIAGFRSIHRLLPLAQEQRAAFDHNNGLYQPGGAVYDSLTSLGYPAASVAKASEFRLLAPSSLAGASALTQNLWVEAGDEVAAVIELKSPDSRKLQAAISELNDPMVVFADRAADLTHILATIRHKAQSLLVVAYLMILAMFVINYRSLVALQLIAIPLGSSLATVAIISAFGAINAFHIFALYLVLGLGIDYAVFLQASRYNPDASTLAAILLSALTSLLSFGLLGLSQTPMIGDFGITLSLGIAINAAVIFLHFLISPCATTNNDQSVHKSNG